MAQAELVRAKNALDIRMDDNGHKAGTNVRELAIFAHYMNLLNGDGKMTSFSGLTKEANNHLENSGQQRMGHQGPAAGYKWLSNLKSDESIISGRRQRPARTFSDRKRKR